MSIIWKFLDFRIIKFDTDELGLDFFRKQKSLPMTDILVLRLGDTGYSLSKWN